MKKLFLPIGALCMCFSLSGCGLMEDAFKAGFIIALIIAAVIGLLIWILHITWKMLSKYFPNVTIKYQGFWDE
jgi:hypothetical protein